jgi:hypothetical protein
MNSLITSVLAAFTKSRRSDRFKARLPASSACSQRRFVRLRVELLEERALLTTFTPLQIRHAYGFDRVGFLDASHSLVTGDGTGQTIAIVDAYDDPNIASNLATFDSTYGLGAPPSFTKVNQTGGTSYPLPSRSWAGEIALDVEYAHAAAPGANILLVEANDSSTTNLDASVQYAANHGATVISMSYGSDEYSGETSRDSVFTHAGVTYTAASGDNGRPGFYPAYSQNVVAVGGTSLTLNSSGAYSSESGWSGSGGGISGVLTSISTPETQPAYQAGVVTQSTTRRTIPDLSFDADPNTGVYEYDTCGGGGLYPIGGTSVASPIMAGLVAVVNQGRSYLFSRGSYNGTDFLNALYHLPQSDLVDITTGNNGYAAGAGYDLVTGRGSPIVDRFVSGMIGAPAYNALTGALLVTGGGRGSSDAITLSQSGGQLVVQVSSSIPVAGSGIPSSQTFSFNADQYSSVTLATSDGTNAVTVDDTANNASQPNVVLSATSLTGLSLGTINFGSSGINTLTINGGNGNNTYTITGPPATQGTTLNTGAGADLVYVPGISGALAVNGSGAATALLGSNAGSTWALSGSDSGTLSGSAYGNAVTFSHVGNLYAGSGGDYFQFADGATLSGGLVGGGSDTLDYSAYSTTVVVDLQLGLATGVASGVSGIGTVYGGTGNGALGAYNLLIGSGGNVLAGGTGRRNILVAGGSPSSLFGGDQEDLLIAGFTNTYDTEAGLASWLQIAAYWAGSDTFATRVANLTAGSGVSKLDATTVSGNGGGNSLSGNGESAWLFGDGSDTIVGTFDANSQNVAISH